jgi:hypothetical protein
MLHKTCIKLYFLHPIFGELVFNAKEMKLLKFKLLVQNQTVEWFFVKKKHLKGF